MGKADPRITSAAFVGSSSGNPDRWSDLDLTFGVTDEINIAEVLKDWTQHVESEFSGNKLFDASSGPSIYRVFLLPGNLQVDLSFTHQKDFGALGPHFRLLWGNSVPRQRENLPPRPEELFGLAAHHLVRARICVERGKMWQAEYWIGEARNYALTLACLHRGFESTNYGRAFDLLPKELLDDFSKTLLGSIDRETLISAIGATVDRLLENSDDVPHNLVSKLESQLRELGSSL